MASSWDSLPVELRPEVRTTLQELGFSSPLPVQSTVIPLLLSKKDVAVEAVTGSGKTLAFVIPVVELLARRLEPWKQHEIGALVISPTFELTVQTHEVFQDFLKHFTNDVGQPLWSSLVLVGGGGAGAKTNRLEDLQRFETTGATVMVATPGRLVDMITKAPALGQLSTNQSQNPILRGLRSLEILILDEADRLLDMGFEAQLNSILSLLPKQRRTGLFSATQTTQLDDLLRAGLRNPLRIVVREKDAAVKKGKKLTLQQRTPSTLENFFMVVEPNDKLALLVSFLRGHAEEKMLVFFASCAAVEYFTRLLRQGLLPKSQAALVYGLHGRMRQKRSREFAAFRDAPNGVLLCTDVMARGIDIPNVNWVIQWDPPSRASFFVHRCGRTARCGTSGRAVLFLSPNELTYIDFLKINQNVSLTEVTPVDIIPAAQLKDPNLTSAVVHAKVQKICCADRLLYEKSIKAYVSFIQFYRKHECTLLFKVKELDFGGLANAYGLLRLPQMPEMRDANISGFVNSGVDVSTLKYREKSVAKQRKLKKELDAEHPPPQRRKSIAWSKKKERKAKKAARQAKKQAGMNAAATVGDKSLATTSVVPTACKRRNQYDSDEDEEDEDFNEDYRKLKKYKKRKVTAEELMGLEDSD
ncbi:hypothetical protein AAHC03_026593 [Spirometra sp. Aus1]